MVVGVSAACVQPKLKTYLKSADMGGNRTMMQRPLGFHTQCPRLFAGNTRLQDRSDFTERHAPEDEEMSKNTYPLKLPTSVKKAAAELAVADGVSLNRRGEL
jgi:hypothetical protein